MRSVFGLAVLAAMVAAGCGDDAAPAVPSSPSSPTSPSQATGCARTSVGLTPLSDLGSGTLPGAEGWPLPEWRQRPTGSPRSRRAQPRQGDHAHGPGRAAGSERTLRARLARDVEHDDGILDVQDARGRRCDTRFTPRRRRRRPGRADRDALVVSRLRLLGDARHQAGERRRQRGPGVGDVDQGSRRQSDERLAVARSDTPERTDLHSLDPLGEVPEPPTRLPVEPHLRRLRDQHAQPRAVRLRGRLCGQVDCRRADQRRGGAGLHPGRDGRRDGVDRVGAVSVGRRDDAAQGRPGLGLQRSQLVRRHPPEYERPAQSGRHAARVLPDRFHAGRDRAGAPAADLRPSPAGARRPVAPSADPAARGKPALRPSSRGRGGHAARVRSRLPAGAHRPARCGRRRALPTVTGFLPHRPPPARRWPTVALVLLRGCSVPASRAASAAAGSRR